MGDGCESASSQEDGGTVEVVGAAVASEPCGTSVSLEADVVDDDAESSSSLPQAAATSTKANAAAATFTRARLFLFFMFTLPYRVGVWFTFTIDYLLLNDLKFDYKALSYRVSELVGVGKSS